MRGKWLLAGLLACAVPLPALAQVADLDVRLNLPPAARQDDAGRLFWLRNAGKVARAKNDFEGSRLAWEAALPLAEKLHGPNAAQTEQVLFELGLAWYNEGQFARALPVYQRDYQLRRTMFGPDSPEALIVLSNIAGSYTQLGRFAEALPVQEQILAAGVRARGEADHDVLIDRNNLAVSYRRLGRFAEAEANFREVIRLRRSEGASGDQLAIAAGNLAQLLFLAGRPDEVEGVVRDAGLLDAVNTPETGMYYSAPLQFLRSQLADAWFDSGKLEPAIALIAPTAARAQARLGAAHPDTIGYERALGLYLFMRGALQREADPKAFAVTMQEARRHASAAAAGLDQRTAALGFTAYDELAASSDTGLRASTYSALAVVDSLTAITLDRAGQAALRDEALQAVQRAMDGTASRAVAETAARNAAAGQGLAPLVEARQALADQWADTQAALARAVASRDAAGEGERLRLVAQGQALESRLTAADAKLQAAFPAYFELIRPKPLTQAQITGLLRPDEAVLLILPTEHSTQVMTITHDGIAWLGSGLSEGDIWRMTRRLLWDVGGNVDVSAAQEAAWSDEGTGAYPFDRTTAYKFYQELIEPSMSEIAGKRHLFVVAGGALSSLPFSLLVTAQPQGDDGDPEALRQTPWLADKVALIQLPSLQSLSFLRKFGGSAAAPAATGREFLGFGDPALDGRAEVRGGRGAGGARRRTGASVSRGGDGTRSLAALRAMVRLPGTVIELEEMRKAMAAPVGQLFTGARATEANFRSADLADAKVIALATHGLMAGELAGNGEPGLVFTPPARPEPGNDGYLTASEITALRFSADWVILSACNTAAGDGSSGAPGLSGLARAFFYAGAGSLLASHWPVRDDVAARLTVRSIEIRRDNPDLSRAEALQRAMREVRMNAAHDSATDTWAHPSAWAPFTLVGDGTR